MNPFSRSVYSSILMHNTNVLNQAYQHLSFESLIELHVYTSFIVALQYLYRHESPPSIMGVVH